MTEVEEEEEEFMEGEGGGSQTQQVYVGELWREGGTTNSTWVLASEPAPCGLMVYGEEDVTWGGGTIQHVASQQPQVSSSGCLCGPSASHVAMYVLSLQPPTHGMWVGNWAFWEEGA